MRENVTISYRGTSYEIGRGPHFYGIWLVGAPQAQPLEWWPETPEGWSSAWARFTGIEAPGTIVAVRQPAAAAAPGPVSPAGPGVHAPGPVSPAGPGVHTPGPVPPIRPGLYAPGPVPPARPGLRAPGPWPYPAGPSAEPMIPLTPVGHPDALAAHPGTPSGAHPDQAAAPSGRRADLAAIPARAGLAGLAAAGLLIVGVVCGIAGLFPNYLFGLSLAQQPAELVPHVIYLAAWAAGALLILLGGARQRMGALFAAGTSIVTFGLFFADAGSAISSGARAMGAGLVLGLVGWLICAIGSGMAVRVRPGGRPAPAGPQGFAVKHLLTAVAALGALGAAIAFAPSWDSYTLSAPNGFSRYITAGNAFSNPGWVIAGDVAVMIALVVSVVAAALWRPVREGAWLLAGAVIPMAAQAISALVQVGEATSPALFGIPPAAASQAGLTITNGVTPAFWLFCAFVLALMAVCAWMLLSPRAAALDTQRRPGPGAPAGPGTVPWPYAWPHSFTGAGPYGRAGGEAPGPAAEVTAANPAAEARAVSPAEASAGEPRQAPASGSAVTQANHPAQGDAPGGIEQVAEEK